MKTNNHKITKFIFKFIILTIVLSSAIISCKNGTEQPKSAITEQELESLIDKFNSNELSWTNFREIVSDSINHTVVFTWASNNIKDNNPTAQFLLGRCFNLGEGVEKDEQKGFEWYTRSADNGNQKAVLKVAQCYEKGIGTEKNTALAKKWFDLANAIE